MSLDQPSEIMKCMKRPVAAGCFIEVGIERASDIVRIKGADPGTSGAAWRKGVEIGTPEIPELLGILVIGLSQGVMAEMFSQPADAPILVTILQVARDTGCFHIRRNITHIPIVPHLSPTTPQ